MCATGCSGLPSLARPRCSTSRRQGAGRRAPRDSLGRLPGRATCAPGAELTIGDDVFINQGASIYAARSVTIGSHALIGDLVCIYDTDFHQVTPDAPPRHEPVTVGTNVWDRQGALLLPGATVGDHAVIAAESVVTGEVPPPSVVAGNPAWVVSTFEADDSWVRV